MKVIRPRTLDEALAAKSAEPAAVPVAGGTDVWVHWPSNLAGRDRTYLDLSSLTDLRYITSTTDTLTIGAGTTYWDVLCDASCCASFPLLEIAARQVGAIQIQARGTWAGNIANGSPAADGVPVLMAYGAEVVLVSVRGSRRVPLDAYYTGYRASIAAPDELIHSIVVPRRPHRFERFEKVGARAAQTITKVGVAVAVSEGRWRVVANSVAATVCRCPAIEALLSGGADVDLAELLDAVDADVSPIDDLRSTAAYRRTVLARVVQATAIAARGR